MDECSMVIRRKKLEVVLSKVRPYPAPRVALEQYVTPCEIAAALLHTAAYAFSDIVNRSVCDFGCGTGTLAIGASYLGAKETVGIDVDKTAVSVAKDTSKKLGLDVDWVVGDIALISGIFDTVLENPPFGVKRRGADMAFLKKALETSKVVYTMHKSGENNRRFIKNVVEENRGKISAVIESRLKLPHSFLFHKKPQYEVKIDIYRIVR
ncbi:MAG: METTL5 family protein [Candidatus Bathyarchaeota archaeon]